MNRTSLSGMARDTLGSVLLLSCFHQLRPDLRMMTRLEANRMTKRAWVTYTMTSYAYNSKNLNNRLD